MKKILRILGALLIVCCSVVCISACDETIADNTKYYDSVTKTLKLQKSYKDKNFYTDGIGEATVAQYTDGDTTLFNLVNTDSGSTVNIRYYSIDTPESTGSVEKWGKAASLFTKGQLEKATSIVLEATTVPASKDSYGTRYLGYVWYKTDDYSDYKCLNLEIVENGFSENRGLATTDYPYNDYFQKANDFARSIKLRIYSELADPLFNDDPIAMTLKEFNENTGAYYSEETNSGSKVLFIAYLKSCTVSSSGTYTFVAEQYDEETGQTYRVNVYTGYSNSPASSMKVGHLYQIIGTVQKYNSTYQIAGPVYSDFYPTPDNTHVEQYNYYWTFNSSTSYTSNNTATLYSDVTVTSVTIENSVMTIVGNAGKCNSSGYAEAEEFTFEVKVPADYTATISVGDTFSANAYKFDDDKDVLTITNPNAIVKH